MGLVQGCGFDCSMWLVRAMNDPFWNKLYDAADTVMRHPETELTIEYGDKSGRVWAKVDPETRELTVAIEIKQLINQPRSDNA